MAETDVFYEFRREPGFSSSVYSPDSSHMLHILNTYYKQFKTSYTNLKKFKNYWDQLENWYKLYWNKKNPNASVYTPVNRLTTNWKIFKLI